MRRIIRKSKHVTPKQAVSPKIKAVRLRVKTIAFLLHKESQHIILELKALFHNTVYFLSFYFSLLMNAFSFDTTDSDNIRSTIHGGNLLSTFSNQQFFALSFLFDFTVFFCTEGQISQRWLKKSM